jgi:carbonic anhydrase
MYKSLYKDIASLFKAKYLSQDLLSGLIVASVAIPLSLAIALASGVDPAAGLVAAIIGGFICALLGSSELAVSGPSITMAVLVAAGVQKFGFTGLMGMVCICGGLQILTGFFKLGSFVRFVPVPVVMGFTAGIGAVIFLDQLPRIVGLPPLTESNLMATLSHLMTFFPKAQFIPFLLAFTTFLIAFVLPRFIPKVPAPLVAVLLPSLVAYATHLPVDTIGSIPKGLPLPSLPFFPKEPMALLDFFTLGFMIYALATLETLLSAGALDQLLKNKPHNPNRELIAQGAGNLITAFFSGLPVSAVIVRSALNVQAGGKTRRAALFHALFVLLAIFIFSPVMAMIPVAVLSGLLISVAIKMFQPAELISLWKTDRTDAYVYLSTFVIILFLDFLTGIQVGITASLLATAWRVCKLKIHLYPITEGPVLIEFSGNFGFIAAKQIEKFQQKIENETFDLGIILDLTKVKYFDHSGARYLSAFIESLLSKNIKVALYMLEQSHIDILKNTRSELEKLIVHDELEMEKVLEIENLHDQLITNRLIQGIERFQKNLDPEYKKRFDKLATGQTPHTLFITCSDSRIDPNLITSSKPGELFIVRNVGNIIPMPSTDGTPAEGAAIEYAVGVLKVKQIIICGHSKCGAIDHVLKGNVKNADLKAQFPLITQWLEPIADLKATHAHLTLEEAIKLNASLQLENLKAYDSVKQGLANRTLAIKAFYYDIGSSTIEIYDEVTGLFKPLRAPIFGTNQLKDFDLNKGF